MLELKILDFSHCNAELERGREKYTSHQSHFRQKGWDKLSRALAVGRISLCHCLPGSHEEGCNAALSTAGWYQPTG